MATCSHQQIYAHNRARQKEKETAQTAGAISYAWLPP